MGFLWGLINKALQGCFRGFWDVLGFTGRSFGSRVLNPAPKARESFRAADTCANSFAVISYTRVLVDYRKYGST